MTRLGSRQRGQLVAEVESARLKPASEASAHSELVIVAASEASAHSELVIVAASEASAHHDLQIQSALVLTCAQLFQMEVEFHVC